MKIEHARRDPCGPQSYFVLRTKCGPGDLELMSAMFGGGEQKRMNESCRYLIVNSAGSLLLCEGASVTESVATLDDMTTVYCSASMSYINIEM